MIPQELHLRNFLSHRETDLDLRGVHLASLIGENGAGKSSLLDAITWVVWGRSRAPYGSDDTLVTHGESSLEVEYVFRMPYQGQNERLFRILRRREQRGRRSTNSVLDFQVQGNFEDNGHPQEMWYSLTDDTIRGTQARIIEYLGLDYDTFINSAYLRQGHADEFTVQSPADRKRVLGAILGLERWAMYRDGAKKRLAEVKGRLQEIDRRLSEVEAELARRPEYEAQLEEAEATAEAAAQRLQDVQAQADELTRIQEQAVSLRRQLDDLDQQLARERERHEALLQEEQDHRNLLATYRDRIARAQEIEAQYQAYRDALDEERAWGEKLSQAAKLQTEKARLEQTIAEAREHLNGQMRDCEQDEARLNQSIAQTQADLSQRLSDLRGQVKLLKERVAGPDLMEQVHDAEETLATYERMAVDVDEFRETLKSAEVEASRRTERNRQLREFMDEKKAALDSLMATVEDEEGQVKSAATCPLCRQPLKPEHREQLLAQIQTEGTEMGDEFRDNQKQLQALKTQIETLTEQIKNHERALRARPRQEQVVARLRQQVEQSEDAARRVAPLNKQVAKLESQIHDEAYALEERERLRKVHEEKAVLQDRLDQQAYAPEARAALENLLEQLADLGYDAAAHDALKARVQELSVAEDTYRELEKARVGVHGEEIALKQLAGELKAQDGRIAQLEASRAEYEEALAELQPRLAEVPKVAQLLHQTRMDEANARQRVGAARQNLAALQTLENRQVEYREQREGLAQRTGVLTELRDAFGVNGIPAMIIEHTLPELEREANRILQQLTGGRMNVRFETQRETKKGTLRETLDIIISDEKGTRPYENFSGGEKFRVNFAIRVALSRLLAQRAGVQLRSLFVDEGFGSLDADGRQRLVEAVKAVQSDFDLILVITHIEELRDAFPTRIQVVKTESGSLVEVV